MTLKSELLRVLPEVLPGDPGRAIRGTELLPKLKAKIDGDYADQSILQTLSNMAQDTSTPIARVDQGQGYYRRPGGEGDAGSQDDEGRASQEEEKFRALYMLWYESRGGYPMHVEHTAAKKQAAGRNRWKYPDVVVLEWEEGVAVGESNPPQFDHHLVEVKKCLGEGLFKLVSVELKTRVRISNAREVFFQCLSNSRWAHRAVLAIAEELDDDAVVEELRRLGASYGVQVVSFRLKPDYWASCPAASKIQTMESAAAEALLDGWRLKTISPAREARPALDWAHTNDLCQHSPAFTELFQWISRCVDDDQAYTIRQFRDAVKLNPRGGRRK